MSSLRISNFRIKTISGGEVFVGGFGDIQQAELRTSLFGSNPKIALKRLRPAGNREQRIRVVAVSGTGCRSADLADSRSVQSLARELRVWHDLIHPNILPLEGFYYDEASLTSAWIATRWHANGNIVKYIQVTKPDLDNRLKLVSKKIVPRLLVAYTWVGVGYGSGACLSPWPLPTSRSRGYQSGQPPTYITSVICSPIHIRKIRL